MLVSRPNGGWYARKYTNKFVGCQQLVLGASRRHWTTYHAVTTKITGFRWMLPEAVGRSIWRKEWDSNPRWACVHGGFQDRCLKPLGHPSIRLESLAPPKSTLLEKTPFATLLLPKRLRSVYSRADRGVNPRRGVLLHAGEDMAV